MCDGVNRLEFSPATIGSVDEAPRDRTELQLVIHELDQAIEHLAKTLARGRVAVDRVEEAVHSVLTPSREGTELGVFPDLPGTDTLLAEQLANRVRRLHELSGVASATADAAFSIADRVQL